MKKNFYCLGLMSGTSMDGIDASIVYSNGVDNLKIIENNYYKYDNELITSLSNFKNKINSPDDLKLYQKDLKNLERKITILHAEFANDILKKAQEDVDLIGFHGQTIYHNSDEKISKQLGDGKLLSQLIRKKIVFNFRENDMKNKGNGAPLAPIYHLAISKKINKKNIIFLNIGGIANETFIDESHSISAKDLGPGNCLIDLWIRLNTKNKYDNNGNIAKSGKINKILLDQSLDIYFNNKISENRSFDVKDFDISFVKGLSIEDGAATLTEYTSEILSKKILGKNIFDCGGGRKNKFLIERIGQKINNKIKLIDEIKIDGDFVESQAFAYLAIRSYLKLPISFPETTGCRKQSTGGTLSKNY